jgi:hypothetical protein
MVALRARTGKASLVTPMDILVRSGFYPVHSFDLYGVLVDADNLGEQKIAQYEELAKIQGIDPAVSAAVVAEYRALLKGDPNFTGRKKERVVNALSGPVEEAGMKLDYKGALLEDGLCAARQILDAHERLIVFSSREAPWLRASLPEDIAGRLGSVYRDNKSEPAAFERLVATEAAMSGRVVSHTADELPELLAARGHIPNLIYVNRNNSNPKEFVLSQGIRMYVENLRDVPYTTLSKQ